MNARILEAWGHRDQHATGMAWDPPHLVAWPAGASTGKALCGKELEPRKLELPGTAAGVGVKVCRTCTKRAAPPPTLAGVVDLAGKRRRVTQ